MPNNTRLRNPFCSQFQLKKPDQAALVGVIRALLGEYGRRLTPEILVQKIRGVYPPTGLFNPNILAKSEYYAKLRKNMELYDVEVPELTEDRKINACRIARALYPGPVGIKDLETSLLLLD